MVTVVDGCCCWLLLLMADFPVDCLLIHKLIGQPASDYCRSADYDQNIVITAITTETAATATTPPPPASLTPPK